VRQRMVVTTVQPLADARGSLSHSAYEAPADFI
jgi:hypothetical protein